MIRKLFATSLLALTLLVMPVLAQTEHRLGGGFRTKTVENIVYIHFPVRCYVDKDKFSDPANLARFTKCFDEGFKRKFGAAANPSEWDIYPITEKSPRIGPFVGVAIRKRDMI